MAHVKTNRFSGNRAVRTLGTLALGAAMTVGGLSFASAGDVQPTPNEVQALGYNTLIFQDEFTGNDLTLRSGDTNTPALTRKRAHRPSTPIRRRMRPSRVEISI